MNCLLKSLLIIFPVGVAVLNPKGKLFCESCHVASEDVELHARFFVCFLLCNFIALWHWTVLWPFFKISLFCVPRKKANSNWFGRTWGWGNNDSVFHFWANQFLRIPEFLCKCNSLTNLACVSLWSFLMLAIWKPLNSLSYHCKPIP